MFRNTEINSIDVIDRHIELLKLSYEYITVKQSFSSEYIPVSASTDLDKYSQEDVERVCAEIKLAIEGLNLMKLADNNSPARLLPSHLEALLSIPAITKSWDMIIKDLPQQFMIHADKTKIFGR